MHLKSENEFSDKNIFMNFLKQKFGLTNTNYREKFHFQFITKKWVKNFSGNAFEIGKRIFRQKYFHEFFKTKIRVDKYKLQGKISFSIYNKKMGKKFFGQCI